MKTIIYYHAPCMDGLTAAWVLLKTIPDAIAKPARFGDPPPLDEVVGFDRVIFADVCYAGEYLRGAETFQVQPDQERQVVVLDHHATSVAMVKDTVHVIDQKFSGAGLALKYVTNFFLQEEADAFKRSIQVQRDPFNPDHILIETSHPPFRAGELVAPLVAYVQDRDLWQWKLPHSREVSAYLKATVQTFADLDDAATLLINDFAGLVATGAVLLRDEKRRVQEAAERAIVKDSICFVNVDPEIRSELGNFLFEKHNKMVVVWSVAEDGKVRCSARGPGARAWAEARGGGGHDNAAGCEITMETMTEMLR